MAKASTRTPAARLTVQKRLLLFCLAARSDWQAASIVHGTAQYMLIRGFSSARERPAIT
jgi:hypothetical protein